MANHKTKLELTWIGKENRPKLEPRILLEDPEKSYHAPHRISDKDIFDNILIYGDNLLALKALEQEYAGKVKCIYIDPPFNTGQAFDEYDDGIEQSLWLSLIHARLELLHKLLSKDGTLFIHIGDANIANMILVADEIFGRNNRQYVVTFKQGSATGHKAINPGCVNTTNFILIYTKDKRYWSPNRVFTERGRDDRYSQFITNIDDCHDNWNIITLTEAYADSRNLSVRDARKEIKKAPELIEEFVIENAGCVIRLARPDYNGVSAAAREMIDVSTANPDTIYYLMRDSHEDMYFINGQRVLFYTNKLKNIDGKYVAGEPLTSLWDDILSNNLHKEGGVKFPKNKKPEALIERVIQLSTEPGDLVLDSFAGSGTTGAVAHKMGRRWIMVELGEHCHSLILPRLKRVIDGVDQDGVSKSVNWQGGGGFRYYSLAPTLITSDEWGNPVINKEYNSAMLAEAMCKLHGFTYAPSEEFYWMQGYSTESDFIYTTTQFLTVPVLERISEEVGENRSLLICCGAFKCKPDRFANLTIKKIPKSVLNKCEWGRDDYSLEISNLPPAPESPQSPEEKPEKRTGQHRRREATLFEV